MGDHIQQHGLPFVPASWTLSRTFIDRDVLQPDLLTQINSWPYGGAVWGPQSSGLVGRANVIYTAAIA